MVLMIAKFNLDTARKPNFKPTELKPAERRLGFRLNETSRAKPANRRSGFRLNETSRGTDFKFERKTDEQLRRLFEAHMRKHGYHWDEGMLPTLMSKAMQRFRGLPSAEVRNGIAYRNAMLRKFVWQYELEYLVHPDYGMSYSFMS